MRRVLFMMWKEVLELRQDPRIFSIIFIAPIMQLTILGYAATTDVRNVPIVIVDADRSAASQALISRFSAVGIFTHRRRRLEHPTKSIRISRAARAWMALSIPPGYGENVAAGRPASLQIVADGSDASSTNIAMGYASNLIAGYAQDLDRAARRCAIGRGGDAGRGGHRPARARLVQSDASRAATSCCRASSRCCCSS